MVTEFRIVFIYRGGMLLIVKGPKKFFGVVKIFSILTRLY